MLQGFQVEDKADVAVVLNVPFTKGNGKCIVAPKCVVC